MRPRAISTPSPNEWCTSTSARSAAREGPCSASVVAWPRAGRLATAPRLLLLAIRAPTQRYARSASGMLLPPHPGAGQHSLSPPSTAGTPNDAAGFASSYGGHRRFPFWGFDTGLRRRASPRCRQSATGPPGSYPDRTYTGRRRRAYEHEDRLLRSQLHLLPCWAHTRSTGGAARPAQRTTTRARGWKFDNILEPDRASTAANRGPRTIRPSLAPTRRSRFSPVGISPAEPSR